MTENITMLPFRRPRGSSATQDVEQAPSLRRSVVEAFRRFWPLTRPDRGWLVAACVLHVASVVFEAATVWMFMIITDDALSTGNLRAFWGPALAWLGLALAGGLASFGGGYLTMLVAERFVLRLRDASFRHVQNLSPDFVERHRIGDLVSRLTGDIDAVEELAASGVIQLVTSTASVLFFAIAALLVRWDLALMAFAGIPVFALAARSFAGPIKRAAVTERATTGMVTSVVEESLSSAALVQAYNRQRTHEQLLHEEGDAWLSARMAQARPAAALAPLTHTIETVLVLLVIGVGTWEISLHRLTLGGLLAFTAYLGFLYPHVQDLGNLGTMASAATAAADRINELWDARPSVTDRPDALVPVRARGRLHMEDVSFRYPGAERPTLTGLSFTALPGRLIVITGSSGAGKSTIARLLLRFADPTGGRILLDGVDIRELTRQALRKNVTLLPQRTQLLTGTVHDNIAYGKRGATDQEIQAAAMAADAHDFISALPDGYETVIGPDGHDLSGGQRQRIAIARAMIREAPVLVLDEPTTGLDAQTATRIMGPVRRLMADRTTILITHDLHLVPQADVILLLDHGRVAESGTHEELMAQGGAYTRLYTTRTGETAWEPAPTPQPAQPLQPQPLQPQPLQPVAAVRTDPWWIDSPN